MKIAIVVSEFNTDICERLLAGAVRASLDSAVPKSALHIERVPGAWEIPLKCAQLIDTKKYDGVIALGCVIRGETDHYRAICDGVTFGLQKVALETRTPIMLGVLMCKNRKQALSRSGGGTSNKGYECGKGLVDFLRDDSKVQEHRVHSSREERQ